MGLDLGSVRIGVALSDPSGSLASPLCSIYSRGLHADLQRLQEIMQTNGVEQVVVGLPITLRGEQGPAAQRAEKFARELAEQTHIPVTTWDERMTTVVAERALLEAGERRKSRRHRRDKMAAAVMLQSYLDAQKRR
ncbi:MAG: Holliday junction resolvase RuvX [Candidatus Zipacnadales bacterium]